MLAKVSKTLEEEVGKAGGGGGGSEFRVLGFRGFGFKPKTGFRVFRV